MKLIVRDQIVFIHCRWRILILGFLQRHKEDIVLTILQMQHTLTLTWPIIEIPVPERHQDFVPRVGSVNGQRLERRCVLICDQW